MAPKGGSGSRNTDKRQAIIEGTQRLMLTAGYGAILDRLTGATGATQPLREVWAYANNSEGTALLMQFVVLASQVPKVATVIGEGGERRRRALQHTLSERWADYGLTNSDVTPGAVLFLLSAIPRMKYLERSLGILQGEEPVASA